jgi:transposase
MFRLDSTCRFWLYNRPVDMRKSFNGLSGIVNNVMHERLRSGDVFIFANASRNMLKMLRQEECGLVLYSVRLDMGRMRLPLAESEDSISTGLVFDNVIGMVRSALESPYVRRMKMLAMGVQS